MKSMFVLAIGSTLCLFGIASACDGPQMMAPAPAMYEGKMFQLPPVMVRTSSIQEELPADIDAIREALKAEKEFKRTGPQLFSMDEANALQKKTGKPVICWMGPHIFASAKARERSRALAESTIQAVMDSDGETRDAQGNLLPLHRVKFTSNGFYDKDSQVAFIPLSKLDASSDRKILAFTRGGK